MNKSRGFISYLPPWLRDFIFLVSFGVWTSVCYLLWLPIYVLSTFWKSEFFFFKLGRYWCDGVAWLAYYTMGLREVLQGVEIPSQPMIYAAKHQSVWDAFLWYRILIAPSAIFKSEMKYMPLYSSYITRAGLISVNRKGGGGALRKLLSASQKVLDQGRSVVIFPQGKRTLPGERENYKSGIWALYHKLEVPVLPAAVNAGIFWPYKRRRNVDITVTVALLPPILPGLPREEFERRLTESIEQKTHALEKAFLDGKQKRPKGLIGISPTLPFA